MKQRGLYPWFVTGFCEGCGSFTYSRSSSVIGLYFALRVSARDLPILHGIQDFFGGAGHIYSVKPQSAGAGQALPSVYFRITRAHDLARIVAHFDRYGFCGAKAQQYSIWREMVVLKQLFRRVDLNKLTDLAAKLSAAAQGAKDT